MSIKRRLAKLGARIVGRELPAWITRLSDEEIADALAQAVVRTRRVGSDYSNLGPPRPALVDMSDDEVRNGAGRPGGSGPRGGMT